MDDTKLLELTTQKLLEDLNGVRMDVSLGSLLQAIVTITKATGTQKLAAEGIRTLLLPELENNHDVH